MLERPCNWPGPAATHPDFAPVEGPHKDIFHRVIGCPHRGCVLHTRGPNKGEVVFVCDLPPGKCLQIDASTLYNT